MADEPATGRPPPSDERVAGEPPHAEAMRSVAAATMETPLLPRAVRLRDVVLSDDQDEEDSDQEELQRSHHMSAAMRLSAVEATSTSTTTATTARTVTAASMPVERAPLPSLVSRSSATLAAAETTVNSPRLPSTSTSGTQPQPRSQRHSSAGDNSGSSVEWGVDGDEGWMPKPARLHSGKTRSCAVCFAPLQYSSMQSWDEYVQSDEYLRRLQENLLCDTFISSLICGESTSGGDLPTEHRMHKNRKLKCRQSVHDYVNMTSAGVIDQAYKENSSVRILEEMLLHGLSTPLFASVLERRLAVISHSTDLARKLMHESPMQRLPREVATPSPNVELHHLAIQTLSSLLKSFDFSMNSNASGSSSGPLHVFEEMTRLLACFPVLSLYSFWSPAHRFPETSLLLDRSMIDASSTASTPRLLAAEFAIDGSETSYWQSQPRPGVTYFNVRHPELSSVSSMSVRWHLKCFPKTVKVQYRVSGSNEFVQLTEQTATASTVPEYFETRFPRRCEEVRLVLSGMPSANRTSCYAIETIKLNVRIANSLFVDPKSSLQDISAWLVKAIQHPNEDVAVEAIGALRGWTLATASLSGVLSFVQMLQTVRDSCPPGDVKQTSVGGFALDQARLLIKGLQSYRVDEIERIVKSVGKKSTSESRKIRGLFEPSCCSAGVTVEDGGMAVRTRETSYQYAAVNVGISSGRASWKFRLDNDTVDDEMTCFGAAILPVTVSGYDSSPNLWMLRGYNGNLYARGHKLSRSIGKVHPGDTVQIDVDMAEGTLAYKINDTDYGAVFTDLAGHEVYPAVSFYGSGKVITLLGVEKWDDVEAGTSAVDPIFLSNLKEYHYSVGYGTLGKGTQLGYVSDTDARAAAATAAPQTSVIRVGGELKQRALSTHPPARGDAFVVYDLGQAYSKFSGSVAVNDDVPQDLLQQRGVTMTFSILGDGVSLWQSKPLAHARSTVSFEVDVSQVRMLELRVSCPGSNQCAHAIWVDPHLVLLDEWKCEDCGIVNKGCSASCLVCACGRRSTQGIQAAAADVLQPVSVDLADGRSSSTNSDTMNSETLFDAMANAIIAEVVDLTEIDQGKPGKVVRFEQPFCRQPCEEVFGQLLAMIAPTGRLDESWQQTHQRRALGALRLLQANLDSLASYEVDPRDLGITATTIQRLKQTLEDMARVFGPSKPAHASGVMPPSEEVQAAAAKALIAGLATLYTPSQKVELLLLLLRGHREEAYPRQSAKRLILSSTLRVLAHPGRDGVLNFLPTMTQSGDSDANDSDAFEQVPLGDIEEVVSLLIATACGGVGGDKSSHDVESPVTSDDSVPVAAMRLLQSYQLMLLAEAIEVTSKKSPATAQMGGQQLVRGAIQEATVNFSSLLLRYCGNVVSQLVEQHAEQALSGEKADVLAIQSQLSARASELPILSKLLPWLVSCLCLLRRQSWLAIPTLPSIIKFSSIMDQYCSELSAVKASESRVRRLEKFVKARVVESQELERMLATDKALATHHQASKPMYNVFKQLYTGDKDHFEGQIGFQFEATSSFSIIALGRSVNPQKNGGQLVRQHAIRLWEEASQVLIAQVTVGATSRKDTMGYAFEPLSSPAKLTQGKLYRLTTQEFANGGDPWYKKENLPDEEYDQSYIKILRDCYASGSTSFPNSQNLSGAAYGVPTFLVEGENPLSKVPRFVAPFGATSLRFNAKRKSPGTAISHSGAAAHVLDGSVDQWHTFFVQTAIYSGVHAVDFVVKCGKPGGVASGHLCVGADWASASAFAKRDSSSFLGTAFTGFGWMPSVGSLWVMGKRLPYGVRRQVSSGDILTIMVDYDHGLVSFAHNGVDMGIAVGPSVFSAKRSLPSNALPAQMLVGISLNGTLDAAQVRPGGVAGSTLRLHWLLDLHTSISSLAGRVCGTLIAGNPVDGTEEELLPWLQSPLLSGGVSIQGSPSHGGREELMEWSAAMLEEDARWKMSPSASNSAGAAVQPVKQIDRIIKEDGFPKLTKKSSFFDDLGIEESSFLDDLVKDMGDSGASAVIISWFEKSSPDRSFLSRLGKFPMCERPMCAALIKHSPIHVLHEVQAIISSSKTQDGYGSIDHIDLVPSDDLASIWKRIVMLRHWLIKTRQEYRARASQDDGTTESGSHVQLDEPSPPAELEMNITVAKSFDDLVLQIHERASFLCILNPPSEERERMRLDSQLALSNLAEKWSAQKTPPSLEPMLERWKSLRESDSSKWSGIVDVLRAQHRWRKRRASVSLTSAVAPDASHQPLEPLKEEEEDDDGSSSKNLKYRDSFAAMLRACDLYIRNGIGAPPEILRAMLDRRQRRSECRVFGLDAMKGLLGSLSMDSTRHNALMFLRPSFRGFTEDEKESRDLNDGQVIAETFRATVRHHYLKGLEGCSRRTIQRVQRSFWNLYSVLACLVAPSGSGDAVDSSFKQAVVCAWCLDFESRDHSFILKSGFLSTLQNEFSMGAVLQRTHEEVDELKTLQQVILADASSDGGLREDPNWHPLSDEFVQRSALSSGLITKRDIMLLILRAPRFACSRKWWQENVLLSDDNSMAAPAAPATRHTVSSMSLRYSELMRNLQSKLSWCEEHTLDRKVLQLGVNSLSSTGSTQGGATSSQAKADQVSYAEVPALGEAANFTLEMWIYPTELGGYRALRADNGLQAASVYVELVDRYIQVAVNGNSPREQLFKTHRFESHEWSHVAVVYQPALKSVQLLVNGVDIQTKSYTCVGKAVIFREARIGCWLSESSDSSALSVGPQRVFKGSIAEIRLWRVARTSEEIRRDYQRAIPCPSQKLTIAPPSDVFSHLIGLWHLDEGEGVCGNNRVEPTGAQASQRIMETAGCNASLVACHWTRANVPVWSGAKVDRLDGGSWSRVVESIRCFQRRVRSAILRRSESAVLIARAINDREEHALMHEWMEEEDVDFEDGDDSVYGSIQAERWSSQESALLKIMTTSTDETLLHQKHVKRCAWIVFRFLSHTAICGTQKRTDSEASTVAAAAKSRRKLRIQSDSAVLEAASPVASHVRAATFEEDDVTKTAELASDAAKTAVTNRKLQEPMAQTLWFSNEVYRKIFEIIEKELGFATVMIQAAEGLTRAQRMVRSTSTPVQDRNVAIRPQQSVLVLGSTKRTSQQSTSKGLPDRSSAFSSSSRGDGVVLEPLELEMHVFNVLTIVLSQSTSEVATTHLARPRMLRELLQLLRLGSPRSQRIVKLILRRICASGVVGPQAVAEIWGSESVLVDLLLDQVAESVCSTAAPMPTLGLSVGATVAADLSSTSASVSIAPITESLANPVGFRSGQVYLAAASESVALLRLLMTDRRWGPVVAELLSVAVKNVTPILSRGAFQTGSSSVDPTGSEIRVKTAIIRAVGALCVLGSHTDCIRIGGKVEVTAKDTQGGDGKAMIDYGFNFSSESKLSNHRPTLATLIELNSRSSTARVVFDGSDESDPSHNVQEVSLATVSPVEEVHLPSDNSPSLSAEMMPVILKLASLDESEVISSFDDLWRMQIRSRALLAFESILRHSASVAHSLLTSEGEIGTARIPPSLLEAALAPVSLSTFVSVPFLQERGRMILCRLIEASTPFGEPMFRGLPDPKPFTLEGATDDDGKEGLPIETSTDPVEEETEEYRVRRGFASTLAAMGFEFDLCMAALENSRNDPNLAVEWLMGPGAIDYQARQEARRLAAATIASRRAAAASTSSASSSRAKDASGDASLDSKAEELQSISGMPYQLAFCALELSNEDPNRAMEWLMEHGHRYVEKAESLLLLSDDLRTETSLSLSDTAALEGIDQPDPLVASASHETSIEASASGSTMSLPTTRTGESSGSDTTNIMAVTLAPILAPLPEKSPASKKRKSNPKDRNATETLSSGFAALDPGYLLPYVLLTVSEEIGPVQRLSTTGRTGVFRAANPKDGVLITFLNTETGAYEDEWHAPKDVRRITKIYDEALDGVASIHRVALRTEKALSTHYARRGVAALLRAWDETVSVSGESEAMTLSNAVLKAVGGPRQFVNLLKLIAASEMVFSRKQPSSADALETSHSFTDVSPSPRARSTHEEPISILHDLKVIALKILREEAQAGKLNNNAAAQWLQSGSPRVTSPPASPRLHAVSESTSTSRHHDTFISLDGEDDDALNQAIALSMQDIASSPPLEESKDEEDQASFMQKLYSSNPRASRTRQPSYAEAQEVASAYLGGSIDDHDGLLSSVLVKECVSHFVESTRVAGEGAKSTRPTEESDGATAVEYQSLHPYYGRCEYTRAVAFDTSHRCLRVKFDQRCKLGPKAKLTFYSDAACEKVITVVDAACTTPAPIRSSSSSPYLSDLMIPSHQFWFKFTASEEDLTKNNGYGYRFQVKPMQSISWANESEVQTNASLEWACWVLEFLLNEATDLVARGAVHNRKIYGALVRYLRSPGAPFKSRVVRLLIQLLHHPDQFPVSEIPDLGPLEGISRLAVAKAKQEKEAGKVFLPAQLLQLVELSIVTHRAADVFKLARQRADEAADMTEEEDPLSKITAASIVLPTPVERKELPETLNDLVAVARFLLGESDELPPHALMAIWLDVFGSTDIIETVHPYSSASQLTGSVEFPGAQALVATFDSRCATTTGVELLLRSCHDVTSAGGGATDRGKWSFGGASELWPSGAVDVANGSSLSYSFPAGENPDALFGVGVCIAAVGLEPEQQLARATVDKLRELLRVLQRQRGTSGAVWSTTMDCQLVDWVNNLVENSGGGPSGLATNASTGTSIASLDVKPSDIRLHRTRDALRCTQLLDTSLTQLQLRFALFKYFNQCVKHTLPLLDLRDTVSPWTLAHTLRRLGHCVFFDIKNALVEAAIDATNMPGDVNSSTNTARITLDRLQALESRDDREVEPSVSECFFAQAFRQLHQVDPSLFRRKIDNKGRLFSVKFRGEEGVDWGGVYREGVNSMVDDLFSAHFNLFVLCPNGQHDTGTNRAMYLPNPKCTSPIAIQMFEFVGKLLGISLRTHGDFPFAFPSLVWKQLIGQPLDLEDLEGSDAMFVQMLDGIKNCERDGIVTEDEFETAFEGLDLRFTAFDCNGLEVELVDDGKTKRVTFANRLQYCKLAETYRLQESAKQITAMARGLATIFPLRVLTLLTWNEMEMLTCGSPKIDIALWKQHTRYDGYNEGDDTVRLFWEAMASFSDEQRSDFVRFAWGRSRLPRGKWPQPFKLTKKGGRDSTLSLPVAHTCFFSVELPPYTTLDKMTTMLLATINFGLGGILMA